MLLRTVMCEKLRSALSGKRYKHTLGVAEEAVRLAKIHGVSKQSAETAGLLHDCAKCMPDALKLRLCREYHIELNEAMLANPDLTHSFLGAEIARREYGVIGDCAEVTEILDAIRYHTTARPSMCTLEKIVFLADLIEPNREPFDALDKIKQLAYEDLDHAMKLSLKKTIEYVEQRNLKMHELTIDAYKYYGDLHKT